VAPSKIDRYTMHPSMRQRVQHVLKRRAAPFIG
jgi:hypothetical protein